MLMSVRHTLFSEDILAGYYRKHFHKQLYQITRETEALDSRHKQARERVIGCDSNQESFVSDRGQGDVSPSKLFVKYFQYGKRQ